MASATETIAIQSSAPDEGLHPRVMDTVVSILPVEEPKAHSPQTQKTYRTPAWDDWPLPPLPIPPEVGQERFENQRSPSIPPPPVPGPSSEASCTTPVQDQTEETDEAEATSQNQVEDAHDENTETQPTCSVDKGKAVETAAEAAEDEYSWARYPPPNCLSQAPHINSQTILDLINVSIENVRNRAAEVERARAEEDEKKKREEEEASAERARRGLTEGALNGEGGQYYLPIILTPPQTAKPISEVEAEAPAKTPRSRSSSELSESKAGPANGHRRHKYNLSRILNRMGAGERGESSATGASKFMKRKSEQDDNDAQSVMTFKSNKDTRLRQLGAIAALLQKKHSKTKGYAAPGSFIVHSITGPNYYHPTPDGLSKGKGKEIQGTKGEASAEGAETTSGPKGIVAENTEENTGTIECISCFDDFDPKEMIKAPCHYYCRDCFTRLISTALENEQQWPAKCCLNEIPFQTIYQYIQSDIRTTFETRALEWRTPIGERIYCSTPECAVWIPPNQVEGGTSIARCPAGHETCSFCRGPAHAGADCPQDWDLQRTNELAQEEGWKRCGRCRALVEHRSACQHMTCRCGYHFCYVCTREWRTCSCTMAQLTALKEAAAQRRQERLEREAIDETELQAALRQVEQLELEEALEAIEQIMTQEREEADRRKKEILNRIRREEERQQGVYSNFRDLRGILSDLQDRQRDILDFDIVEERRKFDEQRAEERCKRERDAETEVQDLEALISARHSELEVSLAREYGARVELERAVEDEYHVRLIAFYSQWKNDMQAPAAIADAEVEKAMQVLRARLDEQHSAWKKWRDEEIEAARFTADEERGLRDELLSTRRLRQEEAFVVQERELEARAKAGSRWYQAVGAERARLLDEMEADEIETRRDTFSEFDGLEVAIVREAYERNADGIETDGSEGRPSTGQAEGGGGEAEFDIWADAIEG